MSLNLMNFTVNCVSYCEEDGCTQDKYTFEIETATGEVTIKHEIICGLSGSQLFCAPSFKKNYGNPIPEHMIHMTNMMLINNDFKMESRYKAIAVENFIKWFTDSMESLSKEKKEVDASIKQLKKEKEELTEQCNNHRRRMATSMETIRILKSTKI